MVKLTYVDDPWVQRAAWESIARLPSPLVGESPDWASALASSDRTVRWAAIQAARTTARDVQPADDGPLSARRRLARLWIAAAEGSAGIDDEGIRDLLLIIQQSPPAQRLEAIRLLQIALGDLRAVEAKPEVYSGYAAAERRELADKLDMAVVRVLVDIFPAGGQELDWEIARTWGMVGIENDEDAIPDLLAEKWTPDSSPLDDIHYLIVASLSPGERAAETTRAAADMLVRLHAKIAKLPTLPGGQWGDRVGEAVAEQFERDPALAPALVAHDDFGSPDHALYVRYLRGELRTAAIQKMLVAARSLDGEDWTTDLVGLLRELPADDVLPDFRRRWREPHLQDSIAQILARYRQGEDRERLIEALGSSDSNVAAGAASALVKMEVEPSPEQIAMALKALRRLLYVPAQKVNRERLIVLLTQWTGQRIQVREGQGKDLFADYHPWFDWFQRAHPTESEKLGGFSGKSAAAWKKRLADVDWTAGDVLRGQQVFNRTTCNRCHTGSTRLGPDLAGVAGRLSRDDLFAAIVDPSQSISPLYRSWLYQTHSGKVFVGLIVYASEAGTILLTGPGVNVRLTGEETAAMRESEISLMPAGLLDDASPGDLADLYAYLQTLKAK
jgi:putative heme-binding domain-containing protein